MSLILNLFVSLSGAQVAYADIDSFIGKVDNNIINPLIGLLFAVAVAYFLYGVFEFIVNQENEEKKTSGKSHMLWGIVGLAIMVGVWSILGFVLNTFGINKQVQITNPQNGQVKIDFSK
jgi:uncharacterized membrane protein YidH (DUF202 family)